MYGLLSLLSSFVSLPAWLRNTIYILGALSLVGIGIGFSPTVALIVAVGVLFVVVVLGIYSYVLKRRREARTAALGGELQQNTQATPSAISDPARKARLEDLRKRFSGFMDRMNELSFNSSLMREMRAIAFVKKLLDEERVPRGRYKDLRIHTIDAEADMRQLGYSSKLNADATFLRWLFELGRDRAGQFLDQHRDKIGRESSTDIAAKFL